jgi:hypothetical protein
MQTYQWIKGENIGTIETISTNDDTFTIFESGRRIKTNLISEFLIDVEQTGEVFIEKQLIETTIDEHKEKNISTQNIKNEIDPISILFKKIKRKPTTINIELSIDLLDTSLYDILKESFNENDLKNAYTSYINDQINKMNIKEIIFNHIKV